jgi:hypothetical protein
MLKASALSWLTALLTIIILGATLAFALGSTTGIGAGTNGLWRPLLPVTLVMGSFGVMVSVLSLLSPTLQAQIRRE